MTVVLQALAGMWDSVQAHHPEVPSVILAAGPDRPRRGARGCLGCYMLAPWEPGAHAPISAIAGIDHTALPAALRRGDHDAAQRLMHAQVKAFMQEATQLSREAFQLRGEVFITDQVLDMGARATLKVVLHEAAHTLATARDIKDTCSRGRYHNGRFRRLAEELGLTAVARDSSIGWSHTTLMEGVDLRYAASVAQLAAALQERGPAAADEPLATRVLRCGCGVFHRRPWSRSLPARGVLCSRCAAAGAQPN